MRAAATPDPRAREPGPQRPARALPAGRPELARQVGALAEANARLDARAQALAERARLLEATLEALDQGVCLCDPGQHLIAWNQTFARAIARSPEPLTDAAWLGDVLRAVAQAGGLGPGPPELLADARLAHLTAGQPIRERHAWADGRLVDLRCRPLPGGGWVLTLTDVTERARATRELQRANRELERFASFAAHDLQAPLRTVVSECEEIGRRCAVRGDAESGQRIADALDGARRMQGLIEDLLALARVGFGAVVRSPLAADRPLDAALANLHSQLPETGARVERARLPTVRADHAQLVQLFQNLIGNALTYRSDARPLIRISAAREGDVWRFACADNGIGIDPCHAERIFQPFTRLHTQAEHPGSGLGLAICQRIVARHGGRIWLDVAYVGGSRFCFTLPGVPD